jgi:hypothetical protein
MADEEFDTAYQQARRLMLMQSTARLQALSGHFITTLERIAEGYDVREAPASAQAAAAKTGLAYSYRSELDEVSTKIDKVEAYYGIAEPEKD